MHHSLQELSTIPVTQSSDFITDLDTYRIDHFAGGGIPFVCGGYANSTYTDVCHKYVATSDEWVISGTMAEARAQTGYGSSESWGLVMAGGFNFNYLSSIESTDNGEIFRTLPDLEIENFDSCLVVVDDDRIFTCGGFLGTTDTFIFSNKTNLWSRYIHLGWRPFQKY